MIEPMERHYLMLFEHAPISLWEQDFSAIKAAFDKLRDEGIRDLGHHLDEHPEQLDSLMAGITVVQANQRTLSMYGVQSEEELTANLGKFFRDEMRLHFREELLALWTGKLTWSGEGVNYTLSGQSMDILLSWRILPGSETTWKQVLVSIEDITQRKKAERALKASENRLRGLFENSPISLWEEDYSEIKAFFRQLRDSGVTDLRAYLSENPQAVDRCMNMIRVLDVNRRTLEMFGARSREELLQRLDRILRDDMRNHFQDELVSLWEGKRYHEAEGVNYTLHGEPLYVHLHVSLFPGYEESFERVLVALEDITARRKAEEYLRYLGTHDVLTGLYNRAYYQEEMKRLNGGRQYPISVAIGDLDGLKWVNDSLGHDAGDNLIRRAAEVLKTGFRQEDVVARIGGDEYAIIMPSTDERAAREAVERIESLVGLNNKYYGQPELKISLGISTGERGADLEAIMRTADNEMYRAKREHYRGRNDEMQR